jgi:hypothetical protein
VIKKSDDDHTGRNELEKGVLKRREIVVDNLTDQEEVMGKSEISSKQR